MTRIGGRARGVCSICRGDQAVRGDGRIGQHGPYDDRCAGADWPPARMLDEYDMTRQPVAAAVRYWTRPDNPLEAIRAEETRAGMPRVQRLQPQLCEEN